MEVGGKTAFVTGANRGLGRAFAEAPGGWCDEGLCRRARSINSERSTARPIRLDVTSVRDVSAAAETCADVDILINNAGAMLRTTAAPISVSIWPA